MGIPLWKAEEDRQVAQRELEEARARMYAAQKKYSLAHDALLAAMEAQRTVQPAYSSPESRLRPGLVDGVQHDVNCAYLHAPAFSVKRRPCNCGAIPCSAPNTDAGQRNA